MAVLREDVVQLRFEVENDPVALIGREVQRAMGALAPLENQMAGLWERARLSAQGGLWSLPVMVVPPPDTAAFMTGLQGLRLAVQAEAAGMQGRMQVLGSEMQGALAGVQLAGVGRDIMRGLLAGMLSQRGVILAAVQSLAQEIKSTMASAMKIASPSKEMAELGRYIGLGLPVGFEQALPAIREGSERMAGAAGAAPAQRAAAPQGTVQPVQGRGLVQNNAYAPQFTLNIGGGQTVSDRELERKVRGWVKESFEDVIAAAAQSAPPRREV